MNIAPQKVSIAYTTSAGMSPPRPKLSIDQSTLTEPLPGSRPNCRIAFVYGEVAAGRILSRFYPGDAYVDWLAIDSYNSGGESFTTVFGTTYTNLVTLAPGKPIMIGETGTATSGGPAPKQLQTRLDQRRACAVAGPVPEHRRFRMV